MIKYSYKAEVGEKGIEIKLYREKEELGTIKVEEMSKTVYLITNDGQVIIPIKGGKNAIRK